MAVFRSELDLLAAEADIFAGGTVVYFDAFDDLINGMGWTKHPENISVNDLAEVRSSLIETRHHWELYRVELLRIVARIREIADDAETVHVAPADLGDVLIRFLAVACSASLVVGVILGMWIG